MTYNKAINVIEYMLSKNPYNKEVVEALTLACTILKKQIDETIVKTVEYYKAKGLKEFW